MLGRVCDCPINLVPMRHPVMASDGYFYEAKALMEHFAKVGVTSPMNRAVITHVTYAYVLKSQLDEESDLVESRHDVYEVAGVMAMLKLQIQKNNVSPEKISLFNYPAIRAAGCGVLTYLATAITYHSLAHGFNTPSNFEHKLEDVDASYALWAGIASSCVDYGVRYASENRFGLFGAIGRRAVQAVSHLAEEWNRPRL